MSSRVAVVVVVLCVLLGQSARVFADPPKEISAPNEEEVLYSCKKHTGPVAVTFKPDTELKDLLTWVMGFTCKSFVLAPGIVSPQKKVTLIVPTTMDAPAAYRAFLVALSTMGLTVVPKGNLMRIVDARLVKTETIPIYKKLPDDSDQVVRLVVRPTYAQPESLKQAFSTIKSEAGDIAVVGSMLVATDYASNLAGMMSLKELVDVPGGVEGIYTIPVKHGDATKMAAMLKEMFTSGPSAPTGAKPSAPAAGTAVEPVAAEAAPSKILVEERTNTVVLSGSEAAFRRAKALVDRVDIAIDMESGGAIHVYPLKYAVAEELAQTLTKAIQGESPQSKARPPGTGPGPQNQPPPPTTPATLDALGAALTGQVHIIADTKTNKLLVTSSSRDYLSLKDVIRELDEPRRQVYIEALILELSADDTFDLGVSGHAVLPGTNGIAVGGVQMPELQSTQPASLLGASGLLGGLLGAPLTGNAQSAFGSGLAAGTSIPSYGLLFKALATTSNTNIISAPSLWALDNETATSKIGRNIPYQAGVMPTTPGVAGSSLTTNISRQPLELELTVKPHITANDTVLLEITHKSSDKGEDSALGPTWTTRDIETRVSVRDQQTVAIGGLMQENETDRVSKVPVLGDIPLLGHLFRLTHKEKHKTNLIVMLTPYIVKDQMEIQMIQERKMRQSVEFFRSIRSLDLMKYEPQINYQRKRGVIEEINRSVQSVEDDIEARKALVRPTGVVPGRVEVPPEAK